MINVKNKLIGLTALTSLCLIGASFADSTPQNIDTASCVKYLSMPNASFLGQLNNKSAGAINAALQQCQQASFCSTSPMDATIPNCSGNLNTYLFESGYYTLGPAAITTSSSGLTPAPNSGPFSNNYYQPPTSTSANTQAQAQTETTNQNANSATANTKYVAPVLNTGTAPKSNKTKSSINWF